MANAEPSDDSGGGAGGGGPARGRAHLNRTLVFSLIALLFGYFVAGRVGWLWRDGSAATREFQVMRTYARVTIPKGSGSSLTPNELADLAEKAIREVNDLMGPVGEASDVRRLNQSPAGDWVEVNPLTWTVVMEALRWNRLSGGAFDPTIGPIKRLFSFDRSETDSWPSPAAMADARARVGAGKLLFEREGMRLAWKVGGMALDLGAIAKGYAVDRAAEVLIANGVQSALIDVGGELRAIGRKPGSESAPWRAGIRNPRGGDVLETLELENAAVATSGDYENFFIYEGKRYEHIIDPRIGVPLGEGVASATVIHPTSCLAADALATTMCVLGPKEGLEFLKRQALGLFIKGARVIMLVVEPDGGLRRIEYVVNGSGGVTIND